MQSDDGRSATGGDQPELPSMADAVADVDAMLESIRASEIYRFYHQKFWEAETRSTNAAGELGVLETVAAHSWGVADAVLILQPHFPQLDGYRCLRLAILHDKPELITGDLDPLGGDGTGSDTHAFDPSCQRDKAVLDRAAARDYVAALRPQIAEDQLNDLLLFIDGEAAEARFVKAVDKLQALAYVVFKKPQGLVAPHLEFTKRFSGKALTLFPPLAGHHAELCRRLVAI